MIIACLDLSLNLVFLNYIFFLNLQRVSTRLVDSYTALSMHVAVILPMLAMQLVCVLPTLV
jgi:hypothetical protein